MGILEQSVSQQDKYKESHHSVTLLNGISKSSKCQLCDKLGGDPKHAIHGELVCESCYVKRIKPETCPHDHEAITGAQFNIAEMNKSQCHCINRERDCQWIGINSKVEEPSKECKLVTVECFVCDEDITDGDNQEDHLEKCKVLLKDRRCPLYHLGCTFQILKSCDIVTHLKNHDCKHLLLAAQTIKGLRKDLHESQENVRAVARETKSKMEVANQKNELMEKQIVSVTSKLQELQIVVETLQKQLKSGTPSTKPINDKELSLVKANIKNMDQRISETSLSHKLFENIYFDGKLIWKVNNIKHRMQQAESGKVPLLHSAPCFTSKYGYKFCARLYLNGDGIGKCTHLSLFIVLMKSEYDSILSWPFKKRVTLKLINQHDSARSVEESFIEDQSNASFQKPTKEMNLASGCPAFIEKADLMKGGFVKDEELFIEISVA